MSDIPQRQFSDALIDRCVSDEPVIEMRGDEMRAFISGIPFEQKCPDGTPLSFYLYTVDPPIVAIRATRQYYRQLSSQSEHGTVFGWAIGRTWHYETRS